MPTTTILSGQLLTVSPDGSVEYLQTEGPIDLDDAHPGHVEAARFLEWCSITGITVPAPVQGFKHRYAAWTPSADDLAKIKARWC